MAVAKTLPTELPIADYLDALDEKRRVEAEQLITWMQAATGAPPVLWGSRIVGFGRYAYRYASGHSGEWPLVGFGIGKAEISLYLSVDFAAEAASLAALGRHRTGVGCLYLKRLAGVDPASLQGMIQRSVAARAGQRVDV